METKKRYDLWLKKVKDKNILKELKQMNDDEIQLAFFNDLEFGTAGLRGIVGAGSNRLNIYNVAKVTLALAEYVKKHNGTSVAVCYDSRNMSKEFAELTSGILAQKGIKVYLSRELMPTPFLSYMVRYYGCFSGVMITASHNPKDYNGYKVYSSDGCQLLEEPSFEILEIAKTIDEFDYQSLTIEEGLSEKIISYTDDTIVEQYLSDVKLVSINKIRNVKVLYSALNGTGFQTIPKVLNMQGAVVELNHVQCVPDKNFTTCPYPNPEKLETYESSLVMAKQSKPDVILVSDPDADRIGVMVRHDGEYVKLNGNEIGVILEDYLLLNQNKKHGIIIKSVVSTNLAEEIAKKHGVECINVLTGFKYIGKIITDLASCGKEKDFILGFEESLGYLVGTHVRDKDATVASMIICEIVSELKKYGKTIIDRLNELYDEFGYYQSYVNAYKFTGISGLKKMKKILDDLRKNPPKDFAGFKVNSVLDYSQGINGLPKANLISFKLDDSIQLMIRPSGTEPLIKVYLTLSKTKEQNSLNKEKLNKYFNEKFN